MLADVANSQSNTIRELSAAEMVEVSGGLLGLASLGLTIEGQSALEVMSHWKEGILVEQVSSYQSISSGSFSIGINV